jgi:NitT/TauT family transport system ATP-binding protein
MTKADAAVAIRGVTKDFGEVRALEDIDLEVYPGEFVSLIGPSGCGKSTLLRVIGDLVQPTRGEAFVNGKAAHQARLDRDYGIVFQDAVLYDWRTVAPPRARSSAATTSRRSRTAARASRTGCR